MFKHLLSLYLTIFLSVSLSAQLITAFSPVKTVTQKGEITMAANSIIGCTGTGTACTNGRAEVPPTGTTNNQSANITGGYIDIDGNGLTFSSSSANLTLGATGGCGVIYAYLVWGGFVTTGTTNYAKRDSVYMQVPGGTSYIGFKADLLQDNTSPYNATYHCYKDVTPQVKAAGPGSYTVANVVAATGGTGNANNKFAGWTLVVIYSDPNLPLRNLTIFRGLAGVSTANPSVQFGISGFYTPPAPAPVNVKVGAVVYDGDRGLTGDSLKFNGAGSFVAVSNAKNPQNDVFNSTIMIDTTEIVRNPSFTNTLGYDSDIFNLANSTYAYLGNSASSAQMRLSTGGETYLVNIVTTSIDVFEPEMRFDKTFVNLSGHNPAQLGDTLEYTLKVYNKGSDPADSLTVIDSLYGALNYVANSMSVVNGPNFGPKSDFIGDDQMDFIASGNFIKARLGNGATGVRGGKLNNISPDSVTTIRFRASITNDCTIFHCMDSVLNMAYATYYGQTSVAFRSTFSSANGIDPATGCALTGPTSLKVTVPACSLPADTSITNCVNYNLAQLLPYRPGYNQYYNSSFTQVTQATATGTYYAIKSIYPSNYYLTACNDTIQINFTSTGPCAPLPIRLHQFDVSYTKPFVDVHWITEQEINNHHFELERSFDGARFEKIAEVPGSLNSNVPKSYRYEDKNFPGVAKLYYRLKQVGTDGLVQTSPVKSVLLDNFTKVSFAIEKVVPNPASKITNINIISIANQQVQVKITSATGKQEYLQIKQINKGFNQIPLDVSQLANGLYFLSVNNSQTGNTSVEKVFVNK